MNKKYPEFFLTATYKPLPLMSGFAEWKKKIKIEDQQEQKAARQEHRPMAKLSDKDMELLLGLGVNGFHAHNWSLDAETTELLLSKGYLFFSYVDDFFFLAPKKPDGSPDYFGCLDEIRKRFMVFDNKFILCAVLESNCPFTGKDYPFPQNVSSRQEAFKIYEEFFKNNINGLIGSGFYKVYKKYCDNNHLELCDLNIMLGHHQQWHHYCAEWGAQVLFSEGNCDILNDQVRTASIRGAARQYDRKWFLYWSSWGGVDRQMTVYDEKGHLEHGITASLALRQWIGSFYSGCDICGAAEAPQSQCFYRDKTGKRQITEFGKNMKKFSDFVFRKHPDRGKPYVPMALMLDYYHGWQPRDHRVWGGSLPYGRDEEMIDNFFNTAFPGQEIIRPNRYLSWEKGDNPFPWQTHEEMFAMEREKKFDNRVYEKGTRTDSTWGDSFDIVLTNCPVDVLKQYRVIVLLGSIHLDDALREKLEEYVKSGGILLVNINHVSDEDAGFLGVEFTGSRESLWEVCCNTCGRICRDGDSEIELVKPTTASVLLKAVGGYRFGAHEVKRIPGYDGADPVATCNKVGKGEVILGTLPYMQTTARHPMHPAFCHLVNHLMDRFLPVHIQGPPIEYLINETEKGLIVTLMHNGPDFRTNKKPETWEGNVTMPIQSPSDEINVEELWTETKLRHEKHDNEILIPLRIDPFDFKIVSINRNSIERKPR